jgi:hypothetical protein
MPLTRLEHSVDNAPEEACLAGGGSAFRRAVAAGVM